MPLFKSRSKSTGRSPSRSMLDINGSLEDMLVLDKTEVESTEQKNTDIDQDWECINILADFT